MSGIVVLHRCCAEARFAANDNGIMSQINLLLTHANCAFGHFASLWQMP
jgi:hypothetical protein